jgi:hypothetical protein
MKRATGDSHGLNTTAFTTSRGGGYSHKDDERPGGRSLSMRRGTTQPVGGEKTPSDYESLRLLCCFKAQEIQFRRTPFILQIVSLLYFAVLYFLRDYPVAERKKKIKGKKVDHSYLIKLMKLLKFNFLMFQGNLQCGARP